MQSWLVALVAIRSLRNFELFKIPHGDFSVAVRLVCSLSTLAQLVLWSQYDHPWSHCYCTRSVVARVYCDCTATMRSALQPQNERRPTATMSDHTANAVAVSLLKLLYSRTMLAVESQHNQTIRISSKMQKHGNPLRSVFRCYRKTAIERRPRCDLWQPSAIWSRRGRRKWQLSVTGV